MSESELVEWASPVQEAAFRYGPAPTCMSGGWGAGKTWVGCMKGLWLSDTFPRNRGVIARRVAKELRATTMTTFYKLCPPLVYDPRLGGRRNDQDGLCKLSNGSEILFLHLDDPATETIIAGLEINWFLIDQAEENPEQMEEIFDKLTGRLGRWDQTTVPDWMVSHHEQSTGTPWPWVHPVNGRPIPPTYAMLACNPDTELHWIYRRFHPESPEWQERYQALGYKMFQMPGKDNRFLPDQYKAEMATKDTTFQRRYWEGMWGIPEGAIHVVSPLSVLEGSFELLERLRRTCTLHRILDHGDTSPTCCLWAAVDRDGNVFVYREYYQPNALISTHRANITALSEGERYEFNLADPSIFFKEMQKHGGRWSVSDEYGDVREHPHSTALFWAPADNNELGTRNRINEYLQVDPERIHPITRQKGSPKLFFVTPTETYPNGIKHALRETRSQRRLKIGTDLGKPIFSDERDPDIIDHAYDPVRYLIASRAPRASEAKPIADGKTFLGAQQRSLRWQKRAGGVR